AALAPSSSARVLLKPRSRGSSITSGCPEVRETVVHWDASAPYRARGERPPPDRGHPKNATPDVQRPRNTHTAHLGEMPAARATQLDVRPRRRLVVRWARRLARGEAW